MVLFWVRIDVGIVLFLMRELDLWCVLGSCFGVWFLPVLVFLFCVFVCGGGL